MSEQTYEERAFNAENECERLRQDLAAAQKGAVELFKLANQHMDERDKLRADLVMAIDQRDAYRADVAKEVDANAVTIATVHRLTDELAQARARRELEKSPRDL